MLSQRPETKRFEKEFMELGPDGNGKINGLQAKPALEKSKLNNQILHKIWKLSDIDNDGKLTLYEFALCKHFIAMKLDNLELPPTTPEVMMKPLESASSASPKGNLAPEDY